MTKRRPTPTIYAEDQTGTGPGDDLLAFAGAKRFATVLADPPWRFINRTGKMAPEHRRLNRYGTMSVDDIAALPVAEILETDGASLSLGSKRLASGRP